MLDHEHGHAVIAQHTEDLGEAFGLDVVESRRRLVQQQHLRVRRQGPAELDSRACPVGRASARRSATSSSPSRPRICPARAVAPRIGRWCARAAISPAVLMLSNAVIDPNTSSRWKVRFIPSRARRWGGAEETSWPSRRTVPVHFWTPEMALKMVVFPAPFGPIRPTISPPFTQG